MSEKRKFKMILDFTELPESTLQDLEKLSTLDGKLSKDGSEIMEFGTDSLSYKAAEIIAKNSIPACSENSESPPNTPNLNANDCEIIITDKEALKYIQPIKNRIREMGLTVGIMGPKADESVTAVIEWLLLTNCMFALIVSMEHETTHRVTLNLLVGDQVMYKNLKVDHALDIIDKKYGEYLSNMQLSVEIEPDDNIEPINKFEYVEPDAS